MPPFPTAIDTDQIQAGHLLKTGIDLVLISRIQASIDRFGERFISRVFTEGEAAYASSSELVRAERFAARFAAKEAALKALEMADKGVAWRDMEVFRHPDGRCELRLHGVAAEHARRSGMTQLALSLSHDGGYAVAIVAVVVRAPAADTAPM